MKLSARGGTGSDTGSGQPPFGAAQSEARAGRNRGRARGLYRELYFDLNVRHFCEKLREEHRIRLSYTWVKTALQGAGPVNKGPRRGRHRRRRPRQRLPGMLLHLDGSRRRGFGDDRWYDLLVVLDDVPCEVYYAQLVEQESTRTVNFEIQYRERCADF